MAGRNFDEWLKSFRKSIANYSYYIDFNKVVRNAEEYKVELNILNSLIGCDDIETQFLKLLKDYPRVLKCIPILLAVREYEIFARDGEGEFTYNFAKANQTPQQYAIFMRKTGLFDLISNHVINNLFDYILGVETGLDSNGRKNRGGDLMEDLVEEYIKKTGFEYYKEMYDYDIQDKFGLDLSPLNNEDGTAKKFDFVIRTKSRVYGIEANFYTSGGSKLNETARSYKMLTLESEKVKGFDFIWITDGGGWKSARHNLKETFDVLDRLYCIKDLDDGVLNKLD